MKKISVIVALLFATALLINCGWLKKDKKDRTIPQFNVTFNTQGGSSIENQLVTQGRYVVEPNQPTKTGYAFGGWYKDSSCLDDWNFSNDTINQATTLYAKWNNYSYTVDFNGDGATTQANPTQKTVATPATTVDALPTPPARSGYYFAGWYTVNEGNGTEFLATTVVTGNITVYAHWTNNPPYTVTFDGQEATTQANPTSKTVVTPEYTVGTLPTAPLKTGYNFGGWYTETNGGGAEFRVDTMVTANITVFAKWNTYSYTVSFDSQGGSSVSDEVVASPSTTVGTMPGDPILPGYSFGGWWTETNGGGSQFSGGTIVNDDITVHAYWVPNTNIITFNANGGNGSMVEQEIVTGDTQPLNSNTYEKAGYSFDGWAIISEGGVVYENGDDYTMGIESVTLYAKWIPNDYTVSFAPNGGDGTMSSQTIACDAHAPLNTNTFTRAGYVFAGWALSAGGVVAYADGTEYTMGTESVTLYAVWNSLYHTASRVYGQDGDFTTNIVRGVWANGLNTPQGVAVTSGGVYLVDTFNNRVLYYEGSNITPSRVYGQGGSFTSNTANNGGISPDSLYQPYDIAVDAGGVYIVDTGNNRVLYYTGTSTTATRVYGQGGSFTSNTANNGGISADSLRTPYGVGVDAGGVYITDRNNHRVLYYTGTSTTATRVYGQDSIFTTANANNGGISGNSLYCPSNVAVNTNGVYITDTLNNRVLYYAGTSTTATLVYGQGGSFTTNTENNGGISADSLRQPNGIAVNDSDVLVSDFGNNRVLYYSGTNTTATRVYGQGGSFTSRILNNGGISADSLYGPHGIAINVNGVYIVDWANHRMLFYSGTSTTATRVYGQNSIFTSGTKNNGARNANWLNAPRGITIVTGGVYIVDSDNHRVLYYAGTSTTATRVYGQGGSFTTNTENNGGISADSLRFPIAVAATDTGVYIVDFGNNRVLYYSGTNTTATRVYGQGGSFTSSIMNNGGISADSLYCPYGIAVDSGGIYIADSGNNRVLYFSGESTTATRVYGQAGSYTINTQNNGGISADSLWYPQAVEATNSYLYIVDSLNHRVLYYAGTSTTATRVYGQGGSFNGSTANNGGISANSLYGPRDIAIAELGIYIADCSNNRALYYVGTSTTATKVFGQNGSFSTNTGNNGGISANSLNSPSSIDVDNSNLYIADGLNNRVLYYSTE